MKLIKVLNRLIINLKKDIFIIKDTTEYKLDENDKIWIILANIRVLTEYISNLNRK
jgi:hypothetical protein